MRREEERSSSPEHSGIPAMPVVITARRAPAEQVPSFHCPPAQIESFQNLSRWIKQIVIRVTRATRAYSSLGGGRGGRIESVGPEIYLPTLLFPLIFWPKH